MKVPSLALMCALVDVACSIDVCDYFGVLIHKGQPFGSAMLISHNTAITTMNFKWESISPYNFNILFGFVSSQYSFSKLVRKRVPSEKSNIMALMFDEGFPDGFVVPKQMEHVSNNLHSDGLVQVLFWYEHTDGSIRYGYLEDTTDLSPNPAIINYLTKYSVNCSNPENIEFKGCAVLQRSMVVGIVDDYKNGAIIFHSTAVFREAWLRLTQPIREVLY